MGEQERVLDVVGAVYEAASEPGLWPQALASLAALVGSAGATLLFGDARSAEAAIMHSVGVDPECLVRYNEHYAEYDVRLQVALRRPVGVVGTNANLMPRESLLRTPFYNEFLEPADLPYMIASILLREESAFSSLGVHRPRRRGEYTEQEVRRFGAVVPHLQRAVDIHRRLHQVGAQASASADALERLALGVILVDADGRPVFVNRSAREILDQRDGLVLIRDGLQAARPDVNRALRRMVHEAIGTASGVGFQAGAAMAIARPSLKRPLSLLVAPMRSAQTPLGRRPAAAVVFLSDPEKSGDTAPLVLQRLYGLTPAEARLATLLAEGRTLEGASEELGISPLTARTQLKSIFRKTQTNRQSELVRLLAGGLGQLRRGTGGDDAS